MTNLTVLMHIAKTCGADGIIHTAMTLVEDCNARPLEAVKVNLEGTVNVLEATRIMDLKKVVNVSSARVMEKHEDISKPNKEDAVVLPTREISDASKLACEQLCRHYSVLHGLKVVTVRFARVYDPDLSRPPLAVTSDPFGNHNRLLAHLIRTAVAGKPIEIPGGNTPIEYAYVKDALGVLSYNQQVLFAKMV